MYACKICHNWTKEKKTLNGKTLCIHCYYGMLRKPIPIKLLNKKKGQF